MSIAAAEHISLFAIKGGTLMADISKITEYITEKAKNEAEETIKEAGERRNKRLSEAKSKADAETVGIIEKAEAQAGRIKIMAKSAAERERLKRLLALKNTAVSDVIKKAKNTACNMPNDEYMQLISRLIQKYSTGEKGTVYFNAADKKRITEEIKKVILEHNLIIADDDLNIDGGFVLKYGYVEENCTIDAMFRERAEEFTDYISENLFK